MAAEGNIISLLLGLISRNITSVQLNLAMNTVQFNYAKRRVFCYLCFLEESLVLERTRIRFGYVWTSKFDLNTLRVDGDIFESGKKKLRIQKYPDTCGRGLIVQFTSHCKNS